MSPFWASFFDHLKDCGRGRNATLFLVGLAGVGAVLGIAGIMYVNHLHEYFVYAIPVVIALAAFWFITMIRQSRMRRQPLRFGPLSCDEARVARSKLIKSQSTKRP